MMKKRLRARQLMQQLTLHRLDEATGEHQIYGEIWARVQPVDMLKWVYMTPIVPEIAALPRAMAVIHARYHEALQPQCLLVDRKRTYKILRVMQEESREPWVKILAEEIRYGGIA